MNLGLRHGAMSFLNGSVRFLEKYPGTVGHDRWRLGQTIPLDEAREGLLVNFSQVQGFQPGSHGLASQLQRRLQTRVRASRQVFFQRHRILLC